MAYFKQVRFDEYGNKVVYETEEDLRNLIMYATEKCTCMEAMNLFPLGIDSYIEQFIYKQNCRGVKLSTRALHFVLSFDTENWEREMDTIKVTRCIYIIQTVFGWCGMGEYQMLYFVHDNPKNRHIHIIINPVHVKTGKLWHWGIGEYKNFMHELAILLYDKFRIALVGTSYIREDNRLCFANHTPILYENRNYSWDPMIL